MTIVKLDDVGSYVLPLFYTAITHPLTHARTLMQLGHEPAPIYLGHSLLSSFGIGSKVEKYPSIFTYCKYMRNEIGIVGIFTIGLPSRILYWNMSSFVSDLMLYKLSGDDQLAQNQYLSIDIDFQQYLTQVGHLVVARTVAVVLAYPLHVFMVRQMSEIMNRDAATESKYMFSLLLSIIDDEGILGLYGGLQAKLIGELSTIVMTAGFVYIFNKYVLRDRVGTDIKNYSSTLGGMIFSNITYRFSVISTVMAATGNKVYGAAPVQGFLDCYRTLSKENGFSRGSSLFLRYVNG